MSSVTSICPSQNEDEPIPIVGIFNLLVINFADAGDRHSKIIEKSVKKYTRDVKLKKFPSKTNFLNGNK